MVTGCHDGTEFEPMKASCGCCLCLSNKRTIIPIPVEGRYRLVACNEDSIGDFKVIAYPTQIPQEYWSSLAMSCCNDAAPPVTIASPDGTITVGGTNPNFQVQVAPVPTAGVLAASPTAMQILCAALTNMGCTGDDETVTTIVPIANGFRYTNEAGTVVDISIPPDVVTTLVPNPGGFTYVNEAGVPVVVTFPSDVLTTLVPIAGGIRYTNEAGTPVDILFPSATVDINVSALNLNATTNQLTVTETDGSTHTVLLGGVSTQANNLLTVGPDNKPYLNCAALAACGFVQSSGIAQIMSVTPGLTVTNPTGPVAALQIDIVSLLCAGAFPDFGPLQCS
jgi:hypothetical protein